jgi:signal transduction histidine kinase/DNA-binding response OmpR family regulator
MAEPLRILLFEDSEDDAQLLLHELQRGGYQPYCHRVDTPEAAQEALRSGDWSLIVSDYSMPRFSAPEALEILRRSGRDIPFIVVSGTIGEELAVTTMKRGAHDYLIKGNLTRLTAAVTRELREAEGRRRRKLAEVALQREQESLQAEVARRRRSEKRLSVQYASALALAESTSLAEAVPRILRSICEVLEWEVGELWQVDQQTSLLRLVETWHGPGNRFPQFEQASRGMTFARGVGLPGRVWASGRPVWIQDVVKDSNLPRARVAHQEGLHAAFGLPIVLREEVLGVMDFFSREIREPDDDLLAMLSTVGSQLGQFIGRRRSEQELIQRAPITALAADIGIAHTRGDSLRDILHRCTEAIVLHLGAAFARIWTLNAEKSVLELQASSGMYTHIDGPHSRVPVGQYKIGLIAQERQPHLTNDVLNDPRVGDQEWARRESMVAFAGYPLMVQDELVGVMAMFARAPLTRYALDGLGTVADTIALGIKRKLVEQSQAGLESQLRQAQKMEAVGSLAGGVAHDFNNLLTAILGYGHILLTRLREDDPARHNVQEILKAGERAAALTNQLLAFSRKQVLQPKILDLNALAMNLEKMLRRLIGEDIELSTCLDRNLGQVRADPGQIEQVIMNLVVNSRDAMPKGGKVTIETANVTLGEDYASRHLGSKPGRYVMLAVADTGVGMDAATQSRVFEPFFTTKEAGKGTGLGLATVYGIIKQSEGYISVYSEPGQGTTFKAYLPRIDQPAETATVGETVPIPRGTETILLVEDEESVRRLARLILERQGYAVIEAPSASSALATAEKQAAPIHLVLTDVIMPEMNGRELSQRLTRIHPAARVLFMSGYTGDTIVRHGVLEPGIAFLQKPFTPTDLARKVREVLDGAPTPPGA